MPDFELSVKTETRIWNKEKGPESQFTFRFWFGLHIHFEYVNGWDRLYIIYEWRLCKVFCIIADGDHRHIWLGKRQWLWRKNYNWRTDIEKWEREEPEEN